MTDTKYNGWTNYATWRINLEMIDGIDPNEQFPDLTEAYDLGQALKEYVEELLEQDCLIQPDRWSGQREPRRPMAFHYALAFISDVDWGEIAEHLLEAYAEA